MKEKEEWKRVHRGERKAPFAFVCLYRRDKKERRKRGIDPILPSNSSSPSFCSSPFFPFCTHREIAKDEKGVIGSAECSTWGWIESSGYASETAFRFNRTISTKGVDSREDSFEKQAETVIELRCFACTPAITVDRKTGFVIPLISFLFIQGAIHVADAREARGLFSVRVQWRAKPSLRRGVWTFYSHDTSLSFSPSLEWRCWNLRQPLVAAAAAAAAARLFPSRGSRINSYSPL